jgi:hypothetical protein
VNSGEKLFNIVLFPQAKKNLGRTGHNEAKNKNGFTSHFCVRFNPDALLITGIHPVST